MQKKGYGILLFSVVLIVAACGNQDNNGQNPGFASSEPPSVVSQPPA